MSATSAVLPLLVFEAAGCLMALPASELKGSDPDFSKGESGAAIDLGEYFAGAASDGPWLYWMRGPRSAWLRVRQVIDVVPVALAGLTPLPALLKAQPSHAFLAAGIRGDEVFLLLDPARLQHVVSGFSRTDL